jgi:hypothetical protein
MRFVLKRTAKTALKAHRRLVDQRCGLQRPNRPSPAKLLASRPLISKPTIFGSPWMRGARTSSGGHELPNALYSRDRNVAVEKRDSTQGKQQKGKKEVDGIELAGRSQGVPQA